jgi:hypothetical protein
MADTGLTYAEIARECGLSVSAVAEALQGVAARPGSPFRIDRSSEPHRVLLDWSPLNAAPLPATLGTSLTLPC